MKSARLTLKSKTSAPGTGAPIVTSAAPADKPASLRDLRNKAGHLENVLVNRLEPFTQLLALALHLPDLPCAFEQKARAGVVAECASAIRDMTSEAANDANELRIQAAELVRSQGNAE